MTIKKCKNWKQIFLAVIFLFFTNSQAKASNVGYIWFSTAGYLDKVNAVNQNMKSIPVFETLPEINSIVNLEYRVPFYSFDTIQKISQHYGTLYNQGFPKKECEMLSVTGGLTVYMISDLDHKNCTIQALNLRERRDYFMLNKGKIRVLGYVIFDNINFILLESLQQ